jgi:hypothetical protein
MHHLTATSDLPAPVRIGLDAAVDKITLDWSPPLPLRRILGGAGGPHKRLYIGGFVLLALAPIPAILAADIRRSNSLVAVQALAGPLTSPSAFLATLAAEDDRGSAVFAQAVTLHS